MSLPKAIPPAIQEPKQTPTLLLFSAARPEALKEMVIRHGEYISEFPEKLSDVAYTLTERREHMKYRAFSIAEGAQPLDGPVAVASQDIEKAAFVFTGQGAQW